MHNLDNDNSPKCPCCKTLMKPINKKYSKSITGYYVSEYNCENCGAACTEDEGIREFFDRDGKKLYGGK